MLLKADGVNLQGVKHIRPDHYHRGSIDVIKFAEENFAKAELRGFYRINVIKYTTRYDQKGGKDDLDKAEFYLEKLKELL